MARQPHDHYLHLKERHPALLTAVEALGAITVQMLRPGIVFSGAAQYHLTTLAELPRLLATL